MKTKLVLVAVVLVAAIAVSFLVRSKSGPEVTRAGSRGNEAAESNGGGSTGPKPKILRSGSSGESSSASSGAQATKPRTASHDGSPSSSGARETASEQDESSSTSMPRVKSVASLTSGDRKTTTVDVLKRVNELSNKYTSTQDDADKSEIISQLADIEDVTAVQQLLAMLHAEADPDLRAEIIQAISWNDSHVEMANDVITAFEQMYKRTDDLSERLELQDAIGEIDFKRSADFLRDVYNNPSGDPEEKLSAAESLLRMRTRDEELLSQEDATAINDRLRLDFQALTQPQLKIQALMAMGELRSENKYFFQQMLASEQDPSVRRLLEQLVQSIAKEEQNTQKDMGQGNAAAAPNAGVTPAATATPVATPVSQ